MHLYKYLVLKPLFEFGFGFFTDFSLAPTDEKRIICTLTFIRRVWDLVLKGQFAQIKKKKKTFMETVLVLFVQVLRYSSLRFLLLPQYYQDLNIILPAVSMMRSILNVIFMSSQNGQSKFCVKIYL